MCSSRLLGPPSVRNNHRSCNQFERVGIIKYGLGRNKIFLFGGDCTALCQASGDAFQEKSQVVAPDGAWDRVGHISSQLARYFAVWVLGFSMLGLFIPWSLSWFNKDCVTAALSLTMLCMGLTLTTDDFKGVVKSPWRLFAGVALQYTIMPSLGLLLSRQFGLPPPVAIGIVLVSCCPGGVASNIVCFIAKADVALSVGMTAVSTFLAVVFTPVLIKVILGTSIAVSGWALFWSTVQVVLAPVILGVVLRKLFPSIVIKVSKVSPLIGVIAVSLIDGGIVSQNVAGILEIGVLAFGACAFLHFGGFALGYALSAVLGFPQQTSRTTSIEVGMQNSGLGSVLAMQHFGDPVTASTCAISACFHSLAGSALAGWWHGRSPSSEKNDKPNPTLDAI